MNAVSLVCGLHVPNPQATPFASPLEDRPSHLDRHLLQGIGGLAVRHDVSNVHLHDACPRLGGIGQQSYDDPVGVFQPEFSEEFCPGGDDASERLCDVRQFCGTVDGSIDDDQHLTDHGACPGEPHPLADGAGPVQHRNDHRDQSLANSRGSRTPRGFGPFCSLRNGEPRVSWDSCIRDKGTHGWAKMICLFKTKSPDPPQEPF